MSLLLGPPTPLPPERLLLPFGPGPFRMALGLTACAPDEIIEIDARYPAEMAERRALLATRRDDVFAAEPGSEAARAETLDIIAAILARRHPTWFERRGTTLHNHLTNETWAMGEHDPLELAGRLVQEDLCVIDTSGPSPVLSAAVLCAPSRWVLADKIGRPLEAVHAAVPMYADRLSRPVDRFMGALRPGRAAERLNWSVVDDGALFQLGGKHRTAVEHRVTPENAPHTLFVRVERQTFLRLPLSSVVVFAIHVHSYSLSHVLGAPAATRDLAAAVRALPGDIAVYKSMPTIRDALLACLDEHAVSTIKSTLE